MAREVVASAALAVARAVEVLASQEEGPKREKETVGVTADGQRISIQPDALGGARAKIGGNNRGGAKVRERQQEYFRTSRTQSHCHTHIH